MNRFVWRRAAWVCVLLASASSYAQQQQADTTERKKAEGRAALEEVIVTAQKRAQALFDVPMAVSAFSGDVLEDMGAKSLSDIAAATPGFTVAESGPGLQQLQIRGISSGFGKATVGYQLDNISLTSYASSQPDAATFDLASVEILRGPQGTLYGEGSMGGTVKLRTRDPVLDEVQWISQASYFTTNRGDPGREGNGVLNVPLTEKSALRFVMGYADLGGYIDQLETNKPNDNTVEKLNGRVRFLWDVADSFTVNLMALQQRTRAGSSNAADPDYTQRDRADVGIDDQADGFSIDLRWDLPWFEVLFTNSLFDREIIAVFDGREGTVDSVESLVGGILPPPFGEPAAIAASNAIESVPTLVENNNKAFVSELRLSGSWQDKLYWTGGLFLKKQDETFRVAGSIVTEVGGNVVVADAAQIADSKVTSVFAQVEYDWLPWLNTAVGARYFEEDLTASVRGELLGSSADSDDDLKFHAFTPRYTATFRLPEDLWGFIDQSMLFVTYAKGFRSGGANIRREGDPVSPTYDPDFLTSNEIGSKLIFLDGRITVEFSYYETEWFDVQVESVEEENGVAEISSIVNAGTAEAEGYDWSLVLKPIPGVQLIYSGGHIDTEYVTDTRSKQSGDPVDFVPQDQYSLALIYSFNWWEGWPGIFRVDYNRQDKSRQQSRTTGVDIESDSITFMNARAGVERETWQLYFYGRNLTDFDGAVAPSLRDRQARARPTHYGVQLNVNF